MSVASDHVALFRSEWTSRFVDTVLITDLTSRGTWNRATKQYEAPSTTTVYNGGALIRAETDTTKNRGLEGEVLYTHSVLVPHDTNAMKPGYSVAVSASLLDTDLTGATMTIQSVHQDSYNTRRELRCLLSQGGGDLG